MQSQMLELYNKKLNKAKDLKEFTDNILKISVKVDYKELVRKLNKREEILKEVIDINEEIKKYRKDNEIDTLDSKNKKINEETNKIINETSRLDNNLRINIVKELKETGSNLNKNESKGNSLYLVI